MTYREDKRSLQIPSHHVITRPSSPLTSSFTSTPSRRRLVPIILACVVLFVLYGAFSSSEATGYIPSTLVFPKGNKGKTWSTSSGHHDSAGSPLAAGLTHSSSSADWESPTKPLPLDATLEERLQSWEKAPLPQPAEWVQFNLQTCPDGRISKNANYVLLEKSHLFWASMNSSHVADKRSELTNYLRKAQSSGLLSSAHWGSGRGLVFTAGNADTFVRVLLTVRMLREHLECELPVEIFSFPGEKPDSGTKQALLNLGASLKIIAGAVKDKKRAKNFHIKASAIIQSSFREPLYLDSDNLPAVLQKGTIEALWDSKGYQKLGMLAWPDYWKTGADIPIWLLIGTQCRDEWEQEAGQLIVDKSKHLDMLLLSEYMLKEWQYWFNLSDGDKDIFRYAMLALRKRWALPGSWRLVVEHHDRLLWPYYAPARCCGTTYFCPPKHSQNNPQRYHEGTTWKRTRSVSLGVEEGAELIDWGVEADMLANANLDGTAIIPAPDIVRRRAALERGLVPFFHGGGESALCVDIEWQDPRTDSDMAKLEAERSQDGSKEKDLSYTVGEDGFRVDWKDPLEMLQWDDDPRLKDFEDRFFDMGGHTGADGF